MKRFLVFLLFCNFIFAMHKDQSLSPFDRLSILDAVATGNLDLSSNKKNYIGVTDKVMFAFPITVVHVLFKEMLDTKTPSDLDFDIDAYERFASQHPEVKTNEKSSPKLQRKYFNVYLHAIKHDYDCEEIFHTYLKAALHNDFKTMNNMARKLKINARDPNHQYMVKQVNMLRKITDFISYSHDIQKEKT